MCKNKLQILKKKQLNLLNKKTELFRQYNILTYTPSSKQLMFHKKGASYKERLFLAGNRCGKTYCGAQEMAMHLTGIYPLWWKGLRFDKPIRAWAASVTSESTRDILQAAYLGSEETYGTIPKSLILRKTYKRSVPDAVDVVYVQHKSGGISQLGFKSYDQGREKFQGTSRHVIHLDEEPELRLYEECLMRTLDCGGSIMMTMTPLKGMSDVCLHFFESQENGNEKIVVQASWEDAPHLNPEDIERMRSSLRPHELEAREKGIPSLGMGKVFPIEEFKISTEVIDISSSFKMCAAVDFGWSNPTAIVWAAYDSEQDVIYITDIYKQSEKTPKEHAEVLKAKGDWIPIVCDPAGQAVNQQDGSSLIHAYERQGLLMNKASNAVEAGLMEMLERMQTGRFKVFSHLDAWFKEFRIYRRDEKGRIVKEHDHLLDATRYLVVSGLQFARCKPQKSKKITRNEWTVV